MLRPPVIVRAAGLTASALIALVACGAPAWTPDQGYGVRLVNTTKTPVTVKFCGNGGVDFCTVDGTVEPGKCSETLTIDKVSTEPGRGAVFEIVGPGRTNGYIAVKPSGNNQEFDVAPRWSDAIQALKSPAAASASGCG